MSGPEARAPGRLEAGAPKCLTSRRAWLFSPALDGIRPDRGQERTNTMAKPTSILVRMVSSADTGYFYVAKKNPRTKTEKMALKKYDPRARKHVVFKEAKIK
jgi:large subunit ribosomal protein L33